MSNSKVEATFHPAPAPSFECPECEKTWGNADAARSCCGDWLVLGED